MSQRPPHAEEAKPLDPIALSLALWLGLMVCALGVQHLAEQATDQAAQQEAAGSVQPSVAQPVQVVWRR